MKTRKVIFHLLVALFSLTTVYAQTNSKDWANIKRYSEQNEEFSKKSDMNIRAVFLGNSITEGWVKSNPDFFSSNSYVGRGISGQTTSQFLLRFRNDVVNLNPEIVVINGGINDIAENAGSYDHHFTLNNIKSMADIAVANGIKVILTSTLPAARIHWRTTVSNTPEKVAALNMDIRAFAKDNNMDYVDYYSAMVDANGGMKPEYTTDGVHVTGEGYKMMERLIKEAIDKISGQ
ncbi:GDSL-type esterase/lipase family protein [Dysgonomonas sp. 520]|uniref:GDSL-type esterase/lipase family protein n=1 Tax=Dysgonomonas sp. 520 TaxID=2302931 RepID=UPI0013D59255|nr:GDSL-type esterase/lipase family protein [Dysgonomonas sp. 520]NDW10822.1 lipase [Dysgonomonas sp. 520]